MRRETLLVIGFVSIVLATVAVIWYFALPALRPVPFRTVSDVTLTIAQTGKTRVLDAEQTRDLNRWLQDHRHGWAPLTSPAPSTGDVLIKGRDDHGKAFALTLWTGVSGADWNNTAIARVTPDARFRVQTFSNDAWKTLGYLIDGRGYARTDVP
ncbi:hypothetical protein [Swaminathania salitolerans]|uniref:Uncharacterized protein n=1 Tax=Swaminathania salitolerans TaxID=182838 RepID=A0A511BMH6_9PROT|nr:hypothetical protein [Swaminathania salitolerans]GBQ15953.1 hypothetical protein AA21291_2360 [Swaminathania salitolerans LMG 21291]GEL01549.1 hypothetical protein SSA02_07120 [Swaminathania salitolerans]